MELLETAKKECDYVCNFCSYYTSKKSNINRHILTSKHIGNTLNINQHMYSCKTCDYYTNRKSSIDSHFMTIKHISKKGAKGAKGAEEAKNETTNKTHICENCNKIYSNRSGLWKHQKKCDNKNISNNDIKTIVNTINNDDELKQFLIEQNNEFKALIIEQNKQIIELSSKSTTTNNNTTNNTNNFNLQLFLNETCKDALNIKDFVNQLEVGINELEETGRLGYAAGISKIFINGLKQLDVNKRPVHCSDLKREIIYIKDENQWAKEDVENPKLTSAIREVANKNIQQISVWTDEHPEYMNSRSRCSDKYMKIVVEAMSGSTPEESDKNYKKIARNITKESVINK